MSVNEKSTTSRLLSFMFLAAFSPFVVNVLLVRPLFTQLDGVMAIVIYFETKWYTKLELVVVWYVKQEKRFKINK